MPQLPVVVGMRTFSSLEVSGSNLRTLMPDQGPHCVAAFELLKRRGLADFELQDVEWSKEAWLLPPDAREVLASPGCAFLTVSCISCLSIASRQCRNFADWEGMACRAWTAH